MSGKRLATPDLGPQPWMDRAACAEVEPELFFATSPNDPCTLARQICAACPVRLECLDYAVEMGEVGIWGGTSEQQRKNLARRRKRKAAA